MVNLGAIGGGALGGAAISIVIQGVDKFSKTFRAADKASLKLGAAITAIGVAGAFAVGGLLKLSGRLEQSEIAFTTMLGSAEKADKLLRDLSKFAAKTPFTIPGIRQNAKMLLAMSIELDDLLPTLKSLGDVASGLSVPLDRLALNFGQVKVQGKLTGRELRDFAVAGVPLIAELAKNLNKTEAEVKEMVSAGKIGFAEVEKAFQTMTGEGGKFFNLMDEQNKSLFGQISNIQDSFIQLGEVMGNVFLPAAKAVAEKLAIIVGWFERHPTIATTAAILLGVATAFALIVGPLLILVAMLPFLTAGFAILTAVTLPMTLTIFAITAGIIALVAAAVWLWKNWDRLTVAAKIVAAALFPMIAIPIAIIKNWDRLKVALARIWNSIVKLTEAGVQKFLDPINFMIRAFDKIAGKFGFDKIGEIKVDFSASSIDIDAILEAQKVQEEITKGVAEQAKEQDKITNAVKDQGNFSKIINSGTTSFAASQFQSNEDFENFKQAQNLLSLDQPEQLKYIPEIKDVEGRVINIQIENVSGADPDDMAEALNEKLKTMISI